MQDSKATDWPADSESDSSPDETSDDRKAGVQAVAPSDTDGWQQYRKWISKAPAPRSRRSSVDPSLYTWKGYRNWSEQVKRNWSDS